MWVLKQTKKQKSDIFNKKENETRYASAVRMRFWWFKKEKKNKLIAE